VPFSVTSLRHCGYTTCRDVTQRPQQKGFMPTFLQGRFNERATLLKTGPRQLEWHQSWWNSDWIPRCAHALN
jgi:hypothetical protein